jgi:outer membrane protein OmpA-like peptidoglycan-associated protein
LDKDDKCSLEAEDKDGFEDEDGCPDPDNDKDGIPDSNDKCPTEAGVAENDGCPDVDTDKDGIVDRLDKCPKDAGIEVNNGCPDVDSDKDGIVDRLDKCSNVAGIAENDGCPDIDTDKDGVVDRLDKCPGELEDKDGFKDEDGCADLDNDGDGIPDVNDKCPNNPGTIKTEGCPKSKELRGALVLKGVNFGSGKSTLLTSSYAALDQIAESLREWPEVRVEIQGHTDNTGDDAMNMELSRQRAETVRQYLINKGIDSDRLTANGYGEDKPIADNKTAAGRAKNRRVEINRIN